ncbi:hypothetical protein GTP55_25585 [Duganella sp. FT109W]|uniref:DUF4760 domain-containing protein n=1 Tax=Duganella margarita TaxID=2692170 RepID=A0ABW9WNB9_9BURK|nr:hypothetical protein [Duganella margarita]MYN42721.1 hypothetical protein [Duganella margarita]
MITDVGLKEAIPIISAGVGALISLGGVVVANLFNIRSQRILAKNQTAAKDRELKIQKLEELYFLFDRWQMNYSITYLNHLRFQKHKLEYADLLDLELERNKARAELGEHQKVQMLMNVYFPDLAKEYTSIEQCRRDITPFIQAAPSRNISTEKFEQKQVEFEKAAFNFKMKISDRVKEIWS